MENFVAAQKAGHVTHMADLRARQVNRRVEGILPDSEFRYDPKADTYTCPAGQTMWPRRVHPVRQTKGVYDTGSVCADCPLRSKCTRSATGRTIHRHVDQELLDQARVQSSCAAAWQDRRRRQHLVEGSFADAANNHGFKRARGRRLWRQQIQDWLIAAKNWRTLTKPTVDPAGIGQNAGEIIEVQFRAAGQAPENPKRTVHRGIHQSILSSSSIIHYLPTAHGCW